MCFECPGCPVCKGLNLWLAVSRAKVVREGFRSDGFRFYGRKGARVYIKQGKIYSRTGLGCAADGVWFLQRACLFHIWQKVKTYTGHGVFFHGGPGSNLEPLGSSVVKYGDLQ